MACFSSATSTPAPPGNRQPSAGASPAGRVRHHFQQPLAMIVWQLWRRHLPPLPLPAPGCCLIRQIKSARVRRSQFVRPICRIRRIRPIHPW